MELQLNTQSYNIDSQENNEIAQKLYRQGYALYWEKCDYDGATNLFDSALSYDSLDSLWCKRFKFSFISDVVNNYLKFIKSLKLKGSYQESLDCFDKALSIDPKNLSSLHCKGECLKVMGQYQESIIYTRNFVY